MRRKSFVFRGVELLYCNYPYRHTSENMRSIEIPIAQVYVDKFLGRDILEFGNVLGHYGERLWPVVDVEERGRNIVNVNIMNWQPPASFDLIVSISTIEHVGWGRYKYYSGEVQPHCVIAKLREALKPGGVLIATVPMGYNLALDKELADDTLGIDYAWFMKRLNAANEWQECEKNEALSIPYGHWQWGGAMAVLQVGELEW